MANSFLRTEGQAMIEQILIILMTTVFVISTSKLVWGIWEYSICSEYYFWKERYFIENKTYLGKELNYCRKHKVHWVFPNFPDGPQKGEHE